jgi:hypothetical protein
MHTFLTTSARFKRTIAFFFLFIGILNFASAELAPGDSLPDFPDMQDQHEVAYPMPEDVSHVAVAYTMGMGKAANGYFAEKGGEYLDSEDAVFIANIYGMPAVGRFFAMPKMRKYPHRIMLADAEGLLDDFPQQEDQITILDLDSKGLITHIRYWNPKSGENPF